MSNKVQFGLKNCHYAVITETFSQETGKWTTTYGTPKAFVGSVNVSLSKETNKNTFYADDSAYYVTVANNGYTGSYEFADIPSSVFEDIFGFERDDNDFLVEKRDIPTKYVALMFEIDGDEKPTRYCLPKVQMDKPSIESATKGESVEPNTQTLDLVVLPRLDDTVISIRADVETDSDKYNAFYSAVPTISFTA